LLGVSSPPFCFGPHRPEQGARLLFPAALPKISRSF
jgi:hypothetical protein